MLVSLRGGCGEKGGRVLVVCENMLLNNDRGYRESESEDGHNCISGDYR